MSDSRFPITSAALRAPTQPPVDAGGARVWVCNSGWPRLSALTCGLFMLTMLVACGADPASKSGGEGLSGNDATMADQTTAEVSGDAGATAGDTSVEGDATPSDGGAVDAALDAGAVEDGVTPDTQADIASSDAEGDATQSADAVPQTGCTPACTMDELCVAGTCTTIVKPCGGACKAGEFCDQSGGSGGVCKSSSCALPVSFANVQKVSYMEIAPSDKGCDLTGDNAVNNVFGKLLKVYPAANTELLKSIQDGLFILLFSADAWKTDGSEFVVSGYLGELDSSNPSCSPTAAFTNCKYTVDSDNFNAGGAGTCPAQVKLAPAKVNAGQLDAGGVKGTTMTLTLPVVGGLNVTLSNARILGETTGPSSWKSTKKGRICGVITLVDFKKAIDAVPSDAWKQIGLDKALVEQVLATFLAPDIDQNKDGTNDAISLALLFQSVPGQITQVIP